MQHGQVVLVDTNVIIEAFRAHCWNAVTTHFTVETVETCYEEALTGDPLRPNYIAVDAAQLRNGLHKRHATDREQRAQLRVRLAYEEGLHAGEGDLFAHALGRSDAWIASCADRAAVYAALELGWEERFVSLEAIAHAAGARPALKHHFSDQWLKDVRTTYLLDRGSRDPLLRRRKRPVALIAAVDPSQRLPWDCGVSWLYLRVAARAVFASGPRT